MAVVSIHAPTLHYAVGVSVFAWAADVIDDSIRAALLALAHFLRDFRECLLPRDLLPFAFTALANSFERIQDSFGVIHLVVSRRSLGAVSSARAWVDGIAFELANLVGVFVNIRKQTTCRFAVEADSGNERVISCHALGPLFAIPLCPIVPYFGRRILANAPIGVDDFGQFDGLAVRCRKLRDGSACGGLRYFFHKVSGSRVQVPTKNSEYAAAPSRRHIHRRISQQQNTRQQQVQEG